MKKIDYADFAGQVGGIIRRWNGRMSRHFERADLEQEAYAVFLSVRQRHGDTALNAAYFYAILRRAISRRFGAMLESCRALEAAEAAEVEVDGEMLNLLEQLPGNELAPETYVLLAELPFELRLPDFDDGNAQPLPMRGRYARPQDVRRMRERLTTAEWLGAETGCPDAWRRLREALQP